MSALCRNSVVVSKTLSTPRGPELCDGPEGHPGDIRTMHQQTTKPYALRSAHAYRVFCKISHHRHGYIDIHNRQLHQMMEFEKMFECV
jgi:hypothetical protein